MKKGLHFSNRCGIISKPSDEAANKIVGVDYNEGPPVPIPNTEVKLACADNTWLETARDDRLMPTQKRTTQCVVLFLCFAAGMREKRWFFTPESASGGKPRKKRTNLLPNYENSRRHTTLTDPKICGKMQHGKSKMG